MGASRSLKRAQFKKQKKEVKQQFNKMTKMIDGMSKTCLTCGDVFDNKNPVHLDNWRVNVYEDRAELYCDKCYSENVTAESMENSDEQGTTPATV